MKKYLFSCLALWLISLSSPAQWVKTGSLNGAKINCFASYGTTLFAGTDYGLYSSSNNGSSWTVSNSGIDFINSITKVNTTLILAASSGIYLSTTNGASWNPPTSSVPDSVEIVSLAVIGSNVFAASKKYGVYFSSNNGTTWNAAANGGLRYSIGINSLAVSGANLYAVSDTDIYVSANNASTWTLKSSGIPANAGAQRLASGGGKLFCGTANGIYLASEPITTWAAANSGLPANTSVSAFISNSANTVLFAATSAGLYLSKDTGKTWRDTIVGLPTNAAIQSFALNSANTLFASCPNGFYSSANGGKNWTFIGCNGLSQLEISALRFNTAGNNLFAATNGSGVYGTSNGGSSWAPRNTGLNLLPDFTSFTASGTSVFASSFQSVYLTANNGTSWSSASSGIPTTAGILSLASSGSSLLAATYNNRVFLSTNSGTSWAAANTGLPASSIASSLASSGTTMYLGTDTDGVYKTSISSINWTSVKTGLPTKSLIRSLAANGAILFASTNAGFYKSTNSGASWFLSGNNLPAGVSFSSIVYSGAVVFIGGEQGVFMSNDNGTIWKDASIGLPSNGATFSSMVINGDTVFVGTNQEGVWKRSISELTCTLFPPSLLTSTTTLDICSETALSLQLTCAQAATFTWIATNNTNVSGESTSNQSSAIISNTLINSSLVPQTVNYTVTPLVSGSLCPAIPQQVAVTVNPKPAINISAATLPICSQSRLSIPITCSIPSTYSWVATSNVNVNGENLIASSDSMITDSLSTSSAIAQTVVYNITPTSTSSSCVGNVFVKTIQVNPLPVIVAVPSSSAVCPGQSVTLSGQGGVSYLWTGNVQNQVPFIPTSSASYTVIGTDVNGCVNIGSTTVTISTAPQMTSALNKSICTGAPVSLSFTSNIAASYQWSAASNSAVTGESTTIQNSSSITDVLINTSSSPQLVIYTVTPLSIGGNCPGLAQNISVTVNPQPVMTSSSAITICDGGTVNLGLSSTIASSFSWLATDNVNVSGESTTTQNSTSIVNTLSLTNNSAQNINYSITPTSLNSNCIGNAQTLVVTINPKPSVTSSAALNICSGSPVNLNLTSDYPSTFLWVASDNNFTVGESTTVQTSNSIFNSIFNSSSIPQQVSYSVTPVATGGNCVGNVQTLVVTVNPQPSMTSANNASICSGTAVGLNFTSNIPASFSWYASDNPSTSGESTLAVSSSSISDVVFNNTTNVQFVNYYVTPLSLSGSCAGNAQNIALAVNVAPTITSTDSLKICTGATLSLQLSSNIPSAYTWIASNNPNVNGESTFLQTSGIINNTLNNISSALQTVSYTVTPTAISGTCAGIPQTLSVKVSPFPIMTSAAAQAICSGDTLNLVLTSDIPSTFNWLAINNPNTIGESILAQNSSFINNTITNTSANLQTVVYTITPASLVGACVGTPQLLQVSVRTLPLLTINALPSSTLCLGNSVSLNASGAATYSWSGNVQNTIPFTPLASGSYTYTVTGVDINGCKNTASKTVNVTALPDTGVSLSSNGNTVSSNESGASYQWQQCNPTVTIAGAINQSYTVTANGFYRVIVRKNNCTDTSACVWVGTLGNKVLAENNTLQLYPNPANENLKIIADFKIEEMRIVDFLGRVVFTQQLNGVDKVLVNMAHAKLSPGAYTLICIGMEKAVSRKLVIE